MVDIKSENLVKFNDRALTWQELTKYGQDRLGCTERFRGTRLIFAVSSEIDALSAFATGISADLDFGILDQSRINDALRAHLKDQAVQIIEYSDSSELREICIGSEVIPGRISVLTSGTTGLPKLIAHNIESLNTFERVRELDPNCWFLPYQAGSYAWYQMIALSLFVSGQDLAPGSSNDLVQSFDDSLSSRIVTAISSTPTFWRQVLMTIDPQKLLNAPIRTITLGGEIVDQAILDRLKYIFPRANIRHIYASSEAGAAIVVTDGRAGFDAALLDSRPERPIAVRIVDGRLQVRSRYGNTEAKNEWIETGDLVEQCGDRILFCGRTNNQLINVGGQKAYPALIEAHLLTHPDVVWARVTAKRAPMVGYLPSAEIVLNKAAGNLDAERHLTLFCAGNMPEYAIPRIWHFLDSVPINTSLKS